MICAPILLALLMQLRTPNVAILHSLLREHMTKALRSTKSVEKPDDVKESPCRHLLRITGVILTRESRAAFISAKVDLLSNSSKTGRHSMLFNGSLVTTFSLEYSSE